MKRRFVLFAVPLILATIGAAPPAPAPLPDRVGVAMVTGKGTILLELNARQAPVTVRNFLRYVDQKRFDGIVFYRAMRLAWGEQPNGLIQAGTRGDPKRVLPPIAHEPTSQTGLSHKAGAISMARLAPGTATGDFSIVLSDMTGLDADPKATDPEAKAGYAVFGRVVGGMDVVRAIWDSPRSPTKGEGVMKGEMLEPPVRVVSARRADLPTTAAGPG